MELQDHSNPDQSIIVNIVIIRDAQLGYCILEYRKVFVDSASRIV